MRSQNVEAIRERIRQVRLELLRLRMEERLAMKELESRRELEAMGRLNTLISKKRRGAQ